VCVSEKGVEENIWVSKGQGNRGSGENYIIRSFMSCTPHTILFT
jgi:hypothetical protein